MLFGAEGAFSVSIDCYDAMWTRHLKLKISIVWHRIESGKCGSSKQCMITTVEGDDIEDQVLASEVVRRTEYNL